MLVNHPRSGVTAYICNLCKRPMINSIQLEQVIQDIARLGNDLPPGHYLASQFTGEEQGNKLEALEKFKLSSFHYCSDHCESEYKDLHPIVDIL